MKITYVKLSHIPFWGKKYFVTLINTWSSRTFSLEQNVCLIHNEWTQRNVQKRWQIAEAFVDDHKGFYATPCNLISIRPWSLPLIKLVQTILVILVKKLLSRGNERRWRINRRSSTAIVRFDWFPLKQYGIERTDLCIVYAWYSKDLYKIN